MNTLILKHDGHEAHVPYELPSLVQFECFVPGDGLCLMAVELRAEDISVEEVRRADGTFLDSARGYPPAVYEQAGDVCAVFERGLESQRLMSAQYTDRVPEDDVADAKVLSTIAEIALLESDLHTAWCRLPEVMTRNHNAPPDQGEPTHAKRMLAMFITEVLVPRAQDLATAAAKRREAQWRQENVAEAREIHASRMTDLAIDLAKERS